MTSSSGQLQEKIAAELRRHSDARGIEPSALVRQWVIEHLDDSEQAIGGPERRMAEWERHIRITTDHLRQLLDERPSTNAR